MQSVKLELTGLIDGETRRQSEGIGEAERKGEKRREEKRREEKRVLSVGGVFLGRGS